jgi:hypothetical protein
MQFEHKPHIVTQVTNKSLFLLKLRSSALESPAPARTAPPTRGDVKKDVLAAVLKFVMMPGSVDDIRQLLLTKRSRYEEMGRKETGKRKGGILVACEQFPPVGGVVEKDVLASVLKFVMIPAFAAATSDNFYLCNACKSRGRGEKRTEKGMRKNPTPV